MLCVRFDLPDAAAAWRFCEVELQAFVLSMTQNPLLVPAVGSVANASEATVGWTGSLVAVLALVAWSGVPVLVLRRRRSVPSVAGSPDFLVAPSRDQFLLLSSWPAEPDRPWRRRGRPLRGP